MPKRVMLIGKLTSILSRWQAEKIHWHLYMVNPVKSDIKQIYNNVEVVMNAINEGKKIQFWYFDYNGDNEKCFSKGGEIYCLSLYAIVKDDDHYYAVGFSDDDRKILDSTSAVTGDVIAYMMNDLGDTFAFNDEYDIDYENYQNALYSIWKRAVDKTRIWQEV